MLGREKADLRVHSMCYNVEVAAIKQGCTEEQTFQILIENYKDFECYSMDMDWRIDELTAYGYAGHTVMWVSRTPSGTGSRLSKGSIDGLPEVQEVEIPRPDMTEKPPDLDRMITMMDTPPVIPQMGQKEMPTEKTPPNSEKKKEAKKKKSKGGEVTEPSWRGKKLGECTLLEEAAGLSTSAEKKMGPKEATLKHALDMLYGSFPEPAPPGAQAGMFVCRQPCQEKESEWKR